MAKGGFYEKSYVLVANCQLALMNVWLNHSPPVLYIFLVPFKRLKHDFLSRYFFTGGPTAPFYSLKFTKS